MPTPFEPWPRQRLHDFEEHHVFLFLFVFLIVCIDFFIRIREITQLSIVYILTYKIQHRVTNDKVEHYVFTFLVTCTRLFKALLRG